MITWQTYSPDQFIAFGDDWQRINQSWLHQPIMDFDFVAALIPHFFDGRELLCVGTDEGHVVTIGFFRKIRPMHWATVVPSQAPLSLWQHEAGILSDTEIRSLAAALPGPVLMIDYLQLDSEKLRLDERGAFLRQPYIETGRLKIPTDFENYFSSLSKNTRQNYRRVNNKAEKEHLEIKAQRIADRKSMTEAVTTYGRIESESWKAEGGTAVAPNNAQGAFYADLLSMYAERDRATCWQLTIGGTTAAVDLCIENGSSTVILKTTFSEEFKRFSPAMQLKFAIIRDAVESRTGVHHLEFFGKAMDWHKKLTNDIRDLEHVTWFSRRLFRQFYQKVKTVNHRVTTSTQPSDHAPA